VVYREIAPIEPLRPWIDCYWVLEGRGTGPQVIYPDGRPELVFHYGDPFVRDRQEQARALYAGQLTCPVTVQPGRRAGVFGVRFTPSGGWAFARFPQAEVTGVIARLDDICGLSTVSESMLDARTTAQRIALIERLFSARLPSHPNSIDLLAAAIAEGNLLSRQARIESGYSDRQWERLFRERTGLRPKMLERISRFRRAMHLSQSYGWADVAAICGYSDQAHLVRDFREFTGAPPTQAEPDIFT
jgi:AraC-like DNA-binding protein